MNIPLKVAVIFGVLGFGVSSGLAHPFFAGSTCRLLNQNKVGKIFDLNTLEGTEFVAPLTKNGLRVSVCRASFPPGPAVILNNANTGFPCFLGPQNAALASTLDWIETIKANGEATLICRFEVAP